MKVIPVCDFNITALESIFNGEKLKTDVISSPGYEEDAYITVFYPDGREVTFWIVPKGRMGKAFTGRALRIRAILMRGDELDNWMRKEKVTSHDLNEKMAHSNQNAAQLGALNVNTLGLCIDYCHFYKTGILDETVLLLGEIIAVNARLLMEGQFRSKVRRSQ